MVTLKGKDADRFIKKMLKREKSPISKKDKKLAKQIKKNMSKLTVVESDNDRRRRELQEKYNSTIKKVDDGLCSRCRKNKATINYTDSIMSYTHGFVEHICKNCYNKIKKSNIWYKSGKKEILDNEIKWLEKYINETTKMRIDATNKYGSISKIPKNILVTLRINTVTEHKIRLEYLKQELKNIENEN
jgi:hypothetical protein